MLEGMLKINSKKLIICVKTIFVDLSFTVIANTLYMYMYTHVHTCTHQITSMQKLHLYYHLPIITYSMHIKCYMFKMTHNVHEIIHVQYMFNNTRSMYMYTQKWLTQHHFDVYVCVLKKQWSSGF